jgi:glycosyltransferase involved in cell wall biosynthesis
MPLRIATTAALWRLKGRPVILHILHAAGGGTEKYVAELIGKVAETALHLVLIAKKDERGLSFSLLISDASDWRVVEFTAVRMADVAPFLRSFGVTQVHVHHFLDIAEQVSSFLKHLGVPYDLSIHDYTAICPRIYLTRNELLYCGEPDEKGCLRCLSEGGYKLSTDILWWRHLGTLLIGDAKRVLCPSFDVAQRIRRYVPNARVIVVPHEEHLYRPEGALHPRPVLAKEPLRVAMLGIMAEHKGGTYLLDCIEAARQRGCEITWHVIGEFSPAMKPRAEAFDDVLSVTGRYDVTELPQLIEKIAPHLVFFPQRCPETYSYTLSEVFAAGIPLLAPEIGAFTERTAGVSWSWTYPVDIAPNQLIDELIRVREQLKRGQSSAPSIIPPTGSISLPLEVNFYREQYLQKTA